MSEDVYIVGASRTVFGRFEGEDHDLAEEAVRGALADAGIT
jgi:acetyl-CoA acetyltransferase